MEDNKEQMYLAPANPNMVWVSKPRLMYIAMFGKEQAYKLVNAKGTYRKSKPTINEIIQKAA